MSLTPGQRLLHYEIVEQIGEGGMGVVWKALDTTLGREVAIKVLPPAVAREPERLIRFEREAKVLAKLNQANIASVFGLHEAGDARFLAMEFVAGEDLATRLARGRLPLAEALGYARQIAGALQSAHENGVVHRDLKPANVMLTPGDDIKVLDFGLAKAFEPDPSGVASVHTDDVTESPWDPRLSPDGGKLLYLVGKELRVRDLEHGETLTIATDHDVSDPFWSPDSTMIGYHSKGRLWKVDTIGGEPTRICDLTEMREAAWNDAGTIGVVSENRLMEVPSRGGEPQTVLEIAEDEIDDFHGIDALPGGDGWVVAVHDAAGTQAIEVVHGRDRRRLVEYEETVLWYPRYAYPGYVIYGREGKNSGIWGVKLQSGGAPFLIAAGGSHPSASHDGVLTYRRRVLVHSHEMVRVTRDGNVLEVYGQPRTGIMHPTRSPDGTQILFSAEENDMWDLWTYDIARGTSLRLTVADEWENLARWWPGGDRIYFHSPKADSNARNYSLPAGGGEGPQDLAHGMTASVSTDGMWMVFARDQDDGNGYDVWSWRLDDGSDAEPWLTGEDHQTWPTLSPDGEWLAYVSNDSGHYEVYVKPFPTGSGRWKVSVDGGRRPAWSADGRRLYYTDWGNEENALYEVDVVADGARLALSAPRLYAEFADRRVQVWLGCEFFPDGESVLVVRRFAENEEEVENAMPGGVTVVQNWLAEFRD